MKNLNGRVLEKIDLMDLTNHFSTKQISIVFNIPEGEVKKEAQRQRFKCPINDLEFFDKEVIEVAKIVCNHYGITIKQLRSKSRISDFSEPRKICYYILRGKLNKGCTLVAAYFNRTHGTVITSAKSVAGMMQFDKNYEKEVNSILSQCKLTN